MTVAGGDAFPRAHTRRFRGLDQRDGKSRIEERDGNALPHRAGADDGHPLEPPGRADRHVGTGLHGLPLGEEGVAQRT